MGMVSYGKIIGGKISTQVLLRDFSTHAPAVFPVACIEYRRSSQPPHGGTRRRCDVSTVAGRWGNVWQNHRRQDAETESRK